jgi:hypothetical protein
MLLQKYEPSFKQQEERENYSTFPSIRRNRMKSRERIEEKNDILY